MKKIIILVCLGWLLAISLSAQNRPLAPTIQNNQQESIDKPFSGRIELQPNQHFYQRMESFPISPAECVANLNAYLNLSEQHRFESFRNVEDDLGVRHQSLQQYYRGIKVEHNMVLLHSRNGLVTVLNGDITRLEELSIMPLISQEQAIQSIKTLLQIEDHVFNPDAELVIVTKLNEKGLKEAALCYKMTVMTYKPVINEIIYVNTADGQLFDRQSLVHASHTTTSGTATTMYNGLKTMKSALDNSTGNYVLREYETGGRNIETYDATNANMVGPNNSIVSNGFIDYTNNTMYWNENLNLHSMRLKITSPNSFTTSEFYFRIVDNFNMTIYPNSTPPVYQCDIINSIDLAFPNLNLSTLNLPCRIQLWEKDVVADDLVWEHTISPYSGKYLFTHVYNFLPFVSTFNTELTYFVGNPALDAHWGVEQAYDYFKNVHGRIGFDGYGDTVKVFINPPSLVTGFEANNAYAQGNYGALCFGLGDMSNNGPQTALETVAHEYSHLLTAWNGNYGLNYKNESGALNESFSDIFAYCINQSINGIGANNWLYGDLSGIDIAFWRNYADPLTSNPPQPEFYQGVNWVPITSNPTEANDFGGVHSNSGVQNHCFYLLTEGLGPNSVGLAVSRDIVYRNLMYYLTPNATFLDSRNGSIAAAIDIQNSPIDSLSNSVVDAWNAVNVPPPLSPPPPLPTCNTLNSVFTLPSGQFDDGSGPTANYTQGNHCEWLVQPTGASQVYLSFKYFNTIYGKDTLWVYDGINDQAPLLGIFTGNCVIPTLKGNSGSLFLRFETKSLFCAPGWELSYSTFDPDNVVEYAYWFDEDFTGRQILTASTPFSHQIQIDDITLPGSLAKYQTHQLHVQSGNARGNWSSVVTHTFYHTGLNHIETFECWFDGDYNGTRQNFPVLQPTAVLDTNKLISAAGLTACGVHSIHIRAKNTAGMWNAPIQSWFYYSGLSDAIAYQYWYDDQYANSISINNSNPSTFWDISTLLSNPGIANDRLHQLHLRVKTAGGIWSSPYVHTFYKGGSNIVALDYWFDQNMNTMGTISNPSPGTNWQLVSDIPVAGIDPAGLHIVHLRARNLQGGKSITLSHLFYNSGSALTVYEYWYDNQFNNRAQIINPSPATMWDINDLITPAGVAPGQIHTLNVRVKNLQGAWSVPVSHTFYYGGNWMTAYQYWYDDDFMSAVTLATPMPLQYLNFNDLMDVTNLHYGMHKLHFRTKSQNGSWSSTFTQTFSVQGQYINSYEYWFDANYVNPTTVAISPTDSYNLNPLLNVSSLANGAHSLYIRFKDQSEAWSTVIVHPFCKVLGVNTVTLNMLLQGYYEAGGAMKTVLINQGVGTNPSLTDSIYVALHDQNSPFSELTGITTALSTNGLASFNFPVQLPDDYYYLSVRHRNTIETWSAIPIYKGGCELAYDFTTSASQAYGANQVEVSPGIFALYSGDINQDENIDLLDYPDLEIDINNFQYGYYATDVNGDGNVDLLDIPLVEENASNFIYSVHP